MEYKLLDSGEGEKLEQFGEVTLIRPAPQALWTPKLPLEDWEKAHAHFSRDEKKQWEILRPIPESWNILLEGVRLRLKMTDFGHLGVFPEHAQIWPWMSTHHLQGARVLNLFAYSGATTFALAAQGAEVTHLDAVKGVVQWAKENAILNGLDKAPIRWIVDDARKYLERAQRRQEHYDAILLDPPSFGRGKAGEIFKIERDLSEVLFQCRAILSQNPLFVVLTCHTPGYTPFTLQKLLAEVFKEGSIEGGEMYIEGPFKLPSGAFARWKS